MSEEISLPLGWAWATIGDVTDPAIEQRSPEGESFTYVEISSIDNEAKAITEPNILLPVEAPSRAKQRLRAGDVLVSMTRPNLNAVALVPNQLDGATGSTGFCVLRPILITPEWLFYLVQSPRFIEEMAQLVQGVVYPAVRPRDIREFRLPLAPLSTQRQIVAEIEKELTRLEAAIASLQKVYANLKRYRSAVVKAACNGFLINLFEERLPRKPLAAEPWPLPRGWHWVKAEDISEFITKGTTPAAEFLRSGAGEVPFIKVYNLTFTGVLDFSKDPTFVPRQVHETELKRSIVRPGDVLMNIVGPPLGKVTIVPPTHPEWNINQAIARYRPLPGLDPRFLALVLQNSEIVRWAVSRSKATAGQFNLTLEIARQIPIPLPPEDQQRLIIAEAERRLSITESTTNIVLANLQKAQHLRNAVLTSAFAGRLTPQDPNDEPASVLLERIRQARASLSPDPRPKKERRKAAPTPLAAKPPRVRVEKPTPAVEPALEPPELDFLGFSRDEQMEVVWETLFGRGALEKHEAIRTAADGLRDQGFAQFKRLRQDGPLYGAIAAAIEKGVREGWLDRPRRGSVRAVLDDPREYAIEDWQRCLLAVVGTEPIDVDTVLRAAAEWAGENMGLEYVRLRENGIILTSLRAALEEAVRTGDLVRKNGRVRRG